MNLMGQYIISEIIPKNGEQNPAHQKALGHPARIIRLDTGNRGVIEYLPVGAECWHVLLTSEVVGFLVQSDGANSIIIETKNTWYALIKTN